MSDLFNVHGAAGTRRLGVNGAGAEQLEIATAVAFRQPAAGNAGGIFDFGTSGGPINTSTIDNQSLSAQPIFIFRVYPANAAAVHFTGFGPQVNGQILVVMNDNNTEGTNYIACLSETGSANQNRIATPYDEAGAAMHVRIGGGCAAAWFYKGPIGGSGRWRLLWLGGAVLNSIF